MFIAIFLQLANSLTEEQTMPRIDPDRICKDDPAYWACALVLAIRNANQRKERVARRELRRLGFDVVRASECKEPKPCKS